MTREIKLECGNVTIKDYSSNIVVFLNDESFSYSFEGDSEFSLDENFNSFIENEFEYQFNLKLSNSDKEKLKECLHDSFYAHSMEVYGEEN